MSKWTVVTAVLSATGFPLAQSGRCESRSPSAGPLTVRAWIKTGRPRAQETRILDHLKDFQPTGPVRRDRFGGWAGKKYEATGFFHPRRIAGRWWLIDPAGHRFLHVAVNSVRPGRSPQMTKAFPEKFGTQARWADETMRLLRTHGFNGTGSWSTDELNAAASQRPPRGEHQCGDGVEELPIGPSEGGARAARRRGDRREGVRAVVPRVGVKRDIPRPPAHRARHVEQDLLDGDRCERHHERPDAVSGVGGSAQRRHGVVDDPPRRREQHRADEHANERLHAAVSVGVVGVRWFFACAKARQDHDVRDHVGGRVKPVRQQRARAQHYPNEDLRDRQHAVYREPQPGHPARCHGRRRCWTGLFHVVLSRGARQ